MTTTAKKLKAGTSQIPAPPRPPKAREKTQEEKQAEVNDLIYRHGSNVPNWANWPTLLQERGLVPADVTPGMLSRAERWLREEMVRKAEEYNAAKTSRLKVVVVGSRNDPAAKDDPTPGYDVDLAMRHRNAILKLHHGGEVVVKPLTRADADSLRVRILLTLADGPRSLEEVASAAGVSPDWAAVQLAVLRAKGEVDYPAPGIYAKAEKNSDYSIDNFRGRIITSVRRE